MKGRTIVEDGRILAALLSAARSVDAKCSRMYVAGVWYSGNISTAQHVFRVNVVGSHTYCTESKGAVYG